MSIGIVEGYIGKKSDFIRTPKFNIIAKKKAEKTEKYNKIKIKPLLIFEFLFLGYGIFQIIYALKLGNIPMALFGLMFALGFGINAGSTVYHSTRN